MFVELAFPLVTAQLLLTALLLHGLGALCDWRSLGESIEPNVET